ncbi:EF-hand calcium-binding domain-containing protein 14 [Pelodytes ibericus]
MGSGALSAGPQAPPTPHKKMKKRKELDALIGRAGDGGGRGKQPRKGSGHRLLRTEPPASDSDTDTEEDGFGPLGGRHTRLGRGDFLQCCKICYPLCGFIVLAACVVTCIGLVWMQVALKENLDVLQEKFRAMESSQKNSLQDIPKINEDLLTKQKHLDEIVSGDTGLNKLWTNITEMNKQIELLTSAVNHLKANIKSASDLINLPNTMEELQKSVASLGSTVTSVHQDVETMQTSAEEQRKKVETLQQDVAKLATKDASHPSPTASSISSGTHSTAQEILYLQSSVEDLNATMLQYQKQNEFRFHTMDSSVANISQRVAMLETDLRLLNKDQTRENDSFAPGADQTETPASELQEKLQLIHALTNKPEGDKQSTKDASGRSNTETITSQPNLARNSRSSPGSRNQRHSSFLPGISSRRDLEQLFKLSDQGINGRLSYEELKNILGPGITKPQRFKELDTDGDNKYSYSELKSALGVK